MSSDGGTLAILGRAAAAVGALCVGVHVAAAVVGGHGGAAERVLFLTMAAACLPCVWALWCRPVRGVWRTTAVMYGGMLFGHLLLLSAAGGAAMHPAGGSHAMSPGADAGMWAGLLLAGVELALAGTVLARGRLWALPADPVGATPG